MSVIEMSEREVRNAEKSYRAATQGMVLLKNTRGALPLEKSGEIALFGLGAVRTVRGGTGSGDPFNGGLGGGGEDVEQSLRYHINILDAFEAKGYTVPTAALLRDYASEHDAFKSSKPVNLMESFAYPDQELSEDTVAQFKNVETAVYVLSRNAGEGADRHMTKSVKIGDDDITIGDYMLCEREIENLRLLKNTFAKTVLILNVGGPVDLMPVLELGIDSILLMGQAGQEGGRALVDVLDDTVNPSGKLTDTWAKKYSDFPAAATFGDNDGNIMLEKYEEGIFVGYRYFDSFGIEPIFEFGYGLSYTEFEIYAGTASMADGNIKFSATVKNVGFSAGCEVVQVYVSKPETELEMPVQELTAFNKTSIIQPKKEQTVDFTIDPYDIASFDETREAYILSKGDYIFRVGSSSRETRAAFILRVGETVETEKVRIEYPLNQELREISRRGASPYKPADIAGITVLELGEINLKDSRSPYFDEAVTTYSTDAAYTAVLPYERVQVVREGEIKLIDVLEGRAEIHELVAQMTNAQLATLCCGTGWGVPDENPVVGGSSQSVPGAAGETTHTLEEQFGVPGMIVADGPAGVRVTQVFEATDVRTGETVTCHHYCTAWPVGTLLAQSFDMDLLEEVGYAIGEELSELGVAVLLGPGMNIHRDPLCGRNFEYYSEDPLLTGKAAAAITRGIQSVPGVGSCLKHYAANNQEANRSGVDTWINQRALREIYLKGFEIAVRESQPMTIMTSYNLINEIDTAHSYDLCTDIARGEWGFRGLIMTDWNGGVRASWKCIHGGNDLIMPGGDARIGDLMLTVSVIQPEFDDRGQVLMTQENPTFPTYTAKWNSFTPGADGSDTVTAQIAEQHTAETRDGMILIDGEPIYAETRGFTELLTEGADFKPFGTPVTTELAELSEDKRSITYRGTLHTAPRICRGDLQRCAMNNLNIIMRSVAMKSLYENIELQCYK